MEYTQQEQKDILEIAILITDFDNQKGYGGNPYTAELAAEIYDAGYRKAAPPRREYR